MALAREVPEPPQTAGHVFTEWRAIADDADAAKTIIPMSSTPQAKWLQHNTVLLPVNFKGTTHARVSWDIKVAADIRLHKGVQFDFYCGDSAPFSSFYPRSFSVYFRSGEGWYHYSFSPREVGKWHRVTIDKSDARSEGSVAGWGKVDAIRFSGWRGGDIDTTCAIANLGMSGSGCPSILVLRADSYTKRMGSGEARASSTYANTLSATLDQLRVENAQVPDCELEAGMLEQVKIVALPYNPSIPEDTLDLLRAFSAQGGKLLVCYSLPQGVAKLLGVRSLGSDAPSGGFTGFERTEQGLVGQPRFAMQHSWRTMLVGPEDGRSARVVATWRDTRRRSTAHPVAITLTPTGTFIGHVWMATGSGDGAALLRSLVCELWPGAWQKQAEYALADIGTNLGFEDFDAWAALFSKQHGETKAETVFSAALEARNQARRQLESGNWQLSVVSSQSANELAERAWFMTRPARASEHRAFWCHSAFGLRGKSWDEAIATLKENGFTAILANMLWAGTAYYPSKMLPEYAELAERGDQIAQCLAACRKYGVKCHVWKVCWNMSNSAPERFVESMIEEGRVQRHFSGGRNNQWLCPSHPANQQLEVDTMLEVARNYDVDGLHFDYIRYPDKDHCFCDGCRARFEDGLGRKIVEWPKAVRQEPELERAWQDFRRSNIDSVVRLVAERARVLKPDIEISAAVFRSLKQDCDAVAQNWAMWCERRWLDFICPMNYFDSNDIFSNMVKQQSDAVGKVRFYPGVRLSREHPRDSIRIAQQIEIARQLGAPGFTVYDYTIDATETLPLLRLGVTAE